MRLLPHAINILLCPLLSTKSHAIHLGLMQTSEDDFGPVMDVRCSLTVPQDIAIAVRTGRSQLCCGKPSSERVVIDGAGDSATLRTAELCGTHVRRLGSLTYTGTILKPESSPFRLFLRYFQAFAAPDRLGPLLLSWRNS